MGYRRAWLTLVLTLAASVGAQEPAARTIVFGSDWDWPPYEFLDQNGQPAGFNVDLIREIGSAVGLQVEVELGPWPTMRRRLEELGTVDVADMFYSEERDRVVDFAEPFTIIHDVIYTRRGAPEVRRLEDLEGWTVLAQEGAYSSEVIGWEGLGVTIISVETEPEALRRLAAGEGDAALVTEMVGRFAVARDQLEDKVVSGPAVFSRPYGFAVDKGRAALRELLDQGLATIRASGRFREIDAKWFGPKEPGWPLARVATLALALTAPILLAALAALAWSRTLRRRVDERTAALREAVERSDAILATAMDGFLVADSEGRIRVVNESYCAMVGYSRDELLEMSILDLEARLTPQEIETVIGNLIATGGGRFETTHRKKDGAHIELDVSASVRREQGVDLVTTFVRDIGERKLLEQQLRQSQKMEAVGRLAGGIAHDFNNLLTVINGYSAVLVEEHGEGELDGKALEAIHDAGTRAAGLTQQLLAFSRRQPMQPTALDLNEVLDQMEGLVRRVIGEAIEVRRMNRAADAWVEADRGQMEQVLMNLLINARDAMPNGGTLTLSTNRFEASQAQVAPALPPGSYVTLTVADSGVGIPSESLPQVFEPFFTTKPVGVGTGLGLATVYGIVKQSGGEVTVTSHLGEGTRFDIYLPFAGREPEVRAPEPPASPETGTETILVVEDDMAVRKWITSTLERRAYSVLSAASGEGALDTLRSHATPVDLILTDVVMPGISGIKLAEEVMMSFPHTRVVFMSGYNQEPDLARRHANDSLLQKPFSAEDLVRTIRENLSATAG